MKTRSQIAKEKKATCNCAQAVACTYADLMGIDQQTAANITAAFGAGMGNMEGTCGSIVGAGVVIGMLTKDRNEARSKMAQLMEKFKARNGSTQCRCLKGLDGGQALRSCPDCCADSAEFLEEILNLKS